LFVLFSVFIRVFCTKKSRIKEEREEKYEKKIRGYLSLLLTI